MYVLFCTYEMQVPPAAIPLQQSEQGQGSSQGTQKSGASSLSASCNKEIVTFVH